jgi:hypothetical protein
MQCGRAVYALCCMVVSEARTRLSAVSYRALHCDHLPRPKLARILLR